LDDWTRGCGECWIGAAEIAAVVASALRFLRGSVICMKCVGGHANTTFTAVALADANHTLSAIVQEAETPQTAREANSLSTRTGQNFWQPDLLTTGFGMMRACSMLPLCCE